MKQMGLAIAIATACAFALPSFAETEATYVPRAERKSQSVYTFKGSSKGLVITDNVTGEETRYTTKKQRSVYRLSPEAEASARESWEERQTEAAEFEAQAAEEAAAAAEAAAQEAKDAAADEAGAAEQAAEPAEESEPAEEPEESE